MILPGSVGDGSARYLVPSSHRHHTCDVERAAKGPQVDGTADRCGDDGPGRSRRSRRSHVPGDGRRGARTHTAGGPADRWCSAACRHPAGSVRSDRAGCARGTDQRGQAWPPWRPGGPGPDRGRPRRHGSERVHPGSGHGRVSSARGRCASGFERRVAVTGWRTAAGRTTAVRAHRARARMDVDRGLLRRGGVAAGRQRARRWWGRCGHRGGADMAALTVAIPQLPTGVLPRKRGGAVRLPWGELVVLARKRGGAVRLLWGELVVLARKRGGARRTGALAVAVSAQQRDADRVTPRVPSRRAVRSPPRGC